MAYAEMLPTLDKVVETEELQAEKHIDSMHEIQNIVLAILIITLLMEALFIFRPLVKRLKRYTEQLSVMARIDFLTDLPNRRYYMDSAEKMLSLAKRNRVSVALIQIDIDHFKNVNDTFGHDAGDEVLKSCANTMKSVIRPSDVIGRLGGEEFSVMCFGTHQEGALVVAEKIRSAVEKQVFKSYNNLKITVSLGVISQLAETVNLDEFLKRADQALYQAKEEGRNRIVVTQ